MRLKGVIIVFLLIIASCSRSGKHGRIPENQLVKILTDIHIADAVSFTYFKFKDVTHKNDTTYYFENLLARYNVTRTQFDSTIAWYSGNPEEFDNLYSKVLDRLNRIAATLNEKILADSVLSQAGNLWNRKRDWILPDDGPRENISFSVKVEKQGGYLLSARIKINPADQSDRPFMMAYFSSQLKSPNVVDTSSLVRLDKSGVFRLYTISLYLDRDTVSFIKGFILGNEPKTGNWAKSAEVRNIRISYKSPRDYVGPE